MAGDRMVDRPKDLTPGDELEAWLGRATPARCRWIEMSKQCQKDVMTSGPHHWSTWYCEGHGDFILMYRHYMDGLGLEEGGE